MAALQDQLNVLQDGATGQRGATKSASVPPQTRSVSMATDCFFSFFLFTEITAETQQIKHEGSFCGLANWDKTKREEVMDFGHVRLCWTNRPLFTIIGLRSSS